MSNTGLSLREKAAQLVFPRLGSNMQPPVTAAEDLDRFQRLLDRCEVGGVIVFNGSYPETTEALALLQSRSNIPLLVTADMERGVGQQIRGATVFPHAMAFSAAGDEELLEHAARAQAREALACGVHVTFSPVADVNRDPRNPIIATRAFGTDPEKAARMVRAFIRGCRAEGLLTTAKHFPGHGNTSRDSHAELPVVESDRDELNAYDLVPFRAAIKEGVDLVMSAHVVYPAIDPDRPSTLSKAVLRRLLRDELGFDGAVITDSLLMGAIRDSHPDLSRQASALVEAGVDILLDVPDPVAAVEGIVHAVEEGELSASAVDAASDRVLRLKARLAERYGDAVFTSPGSIHTGSQVGAGAHVDLAVRAARAAVTVVDDPSGVIPISAADVQSGGMLAVLIKPHRTRLDPEIEPFDFAIRDAYPGAQYRQLGPESTPSELDAVREAASRARYVVVALVVKPAAWHAFGLLPQQDDLVRDLTARHTPLVISLGSPFILDAYDRAAARICSYSDVEVSQKAVVERLAGR